jgi:hypothetical protein
VQIAGGAGSVGHVGMRRQAGRFSRQRQSASLHKGVTCFQGKWANSDQLGLGGAPTRIRLAGGCAGG